MFSSLFHFFALILFTATALAQPTSFYQAKRLLPQIYQDNPVTFYCGCNYDLTQQANMIDRASCGYIPRNTLTRAGNINKRALRIEWEHVVPVPFIFSKYGQEKSLKLYVVKS